MGLQFALSPCYQILMIALRNKSAIFSLYLHCYYHTALWSCPWAWCSDCPAPIPSPVTLRLQGLGCELWSIPSAHPSLPFNLGYNSQPDDPSQVSSPVLTSVSRSIKWGNDSLCLGGLCCQTYMKCHLSLFLLGDFEQVILPLVPQFPLYLTSQRWGGDEDSGG